MPRSTKLQVRFSVAPIRKEVDILLYFCFPDDPAWNWTSAIWKAHPELQQQLKGKTAHNARAVITRYVRAYHEAHRSELAALVVRYQCEWDALNDRYLALLVTHMETAFPERRKTMNAYVSLVPIFPRNLDAWSFHVGIDPKQVVTIAFHEILHFFYFKKWMEVFPDTRPEERDSPHLVWKLSEMLDPIILNNHSDIQKLCRKKQGQYPEFDRLLVGKEKLVDRFETLYRAHLASEESFEDFLRTAWRETLRHRALLGCGEGEYC